MKLTVLSVAYPLAPVGPDAVGGAEQVLTQLDSALTAAGHQSIVIGCGGSRTFGSLVEIPGASGCIDSAARQRAHLETLHKITDVLERYPIDLIHMHGVDFYRYLPPPGPPVLVTLHLPIHWYPENIFQLPRENTFLHCVSHSQRMTCPPDAPLLGVVPNGVEIPATRHAKRQYTVSLGRICPEKGFHIALEAAAQAGVRYYLAGEVFGYAAHQKYFQREIIPRLSGSRRFIGPIGVRRKRRLLSGAQCLLAPSLAPETSSLVAMEALACGTPVVAFPSGALREIVEQGKTGFLVNDQTEMAEAITAARDLDPEDCRGAASQRFPLAAMIDGYFQMYFDLVQASRPTV